MRSVAGLDVPSRVLMLSYRTREEVALHICFTVVPMRSPFLLWLPEVSVLLSLVRSLACYQAYLQLCACPRHMCCCRALALSYVSLRWCPF